MKPWRAAETRATASGKSTRIASRSAIACSSELPVAWSWPSAAAVSSTAVFSVSVANCSRCASCTDSACCSANSRSPRSRSSGSPPSGKPKLPSTADSIRNARRGKENGPMETAGAPSPPVPARADRAWPWPELDLPNLLWFFGAIVATVASIAIVDKVPQSQRDAWELLASVGFLVVYLLAGVLLLRSGWRVPGGLGVTVATAMVPAAAYGFMRLIGVYPDDPFFEPFANYSGALFAVGCVTGVAALVAYAFTRFSFVLALAAGAAQVSGQLLAPAWNASGDGRA